MGFYIQSCSGNWQVGDSFKYNGGLTTQIIYTIKYIIVGRYPGTPYSGHR